jgi:hypothetical protein
MRLFGNQNNNTFFSIFLCLYASLLLLLLLLLLLIPSDTKESTLALTTLHNLNNRDEWDAILRRNGTIVDVQGVMRVNGWILLTRSFGDRSLKPPLIVTPDVNIVEFDRWTHLVIGSDGVCHGRGACRGNTSS